MLKPTTKDFLYLASLLFGLGVTWGSLSSRLSAQEVAVLPLASSVVKIAILETKLDYVIGLLEYRFGIRASQPSKIVHPGP